MRFTSLTRVFDEKKRANQSLRARRRHRAASRLRPSGLAIELLEDRTLMAIAGPELAGNLTQLTAGGFRDNYSSPSIAINPVDPLDMVSAWTFNCHPTDCPDPLQKVHAQASFSDNGGATWAPIDLPATLFDPNTLDQTPPEQFEHVTDISVSWDRGNNIYILYSQHTENYSTGTLTLQKYLVSPLGLVHQFEKAIYLWDSDGQDSFGIGYEAALHPTMIVDNNLPSFTDPTTGHVQTDPNSGTVYIAWNTNEPPPQSAPTFNPYAIVLTASSNAGVSFSPPQLVNVNGYSGNRMARPKLAVSQGTTPNAIANVPGGQLTIVWDDFGPAQGANEALLDAMQTRAYPTGGAGFEVMCLTSKLPKPPDPTTCGDIEHPTETGGDVTTTFTKTVTPAEAARLGADVTDIGVFLAIDSNHLPAMEIRLISPGGQIYTLVKNKTNADGTQNMTDGVAASPMGVVKPGDGPGVPFYTVFRRQVPPGGFKIDNPMAQAPYIDTFLPEGQEDGPAGGLPAVPFPSTDADGIWKLEIQSFDVKGEDETSILVNWGISFAGKFDPEPQRTVRTPVTFIPGARGGPAPGDYISKPPFAPDVGVSPAPVILSDNTLGSFSPFQGRLYVAYAGLLFRNELPNNTDIILWKSDDAGETWQLLGPINDDVANDGFSTGTRPQIQPNLAIDLYNGTLVASFLDFRYDPAQRRYVNTITASIDGGQTWSKQIWTNRSLGGERTGGATAALRDVPVIDAITGKNVLIAPIPDNQSDSNPLKDPLFNMGDHQGLAVVRGQIITLWAGNQNIGRENLDDNDSANQDAWLRQRIYLARATYQAGPSIISSTMGPAQGVNVAGFEFNKQFTANGLPLIDGFAVIFDRPVNPATFTPATVQAKYRSSEPVAGFIDVPVDQVIALNTNIYGATAFFIHFTTPQLATGTYSYVILPNVRDRIRWPLGGVPGNFMDQNANSVIGQQPTAATGGDSYAAPTPLNNGPNFLAPYDQDTLPIIIPGPYVAKTNVAGTPVSADNLVQDKKVSSIDVSFDRDMQPGSVTPDKILRMHGPAGNISGPFTVTPNPLGTDPDPNFPRTYRIGFSEQKLSGTYTITLASTVRAKGGKELDTEKDAGVDILFQKPTAGTESKLFANGTDVFIGPNSTATSVINVPEGFVIQGFTVGNANSPGLDINFPDVRFLSAKLIAPDGTEVQLFTKPGGTKPPPYNDVKGTILDDAASTPQGGTNPIQSASAPFDGRFNPQKPLTVLKGKLSSGNYTLVLTNESNFTGILNAWSIVLQKAISQTGVGEPIADQASISFRIFSVGKNQPIAQQTWTAVGPASNNNNGNSSRIGGIAVDASDPTGNTVYVAGASGGVWKTTNFMTTSPIGPTWIPLTDFGPIDSLNIGGISLFSRNNDPKQTMIFVATGEGDTGSRGAGIMRSMDAGLTWTQLDSTDNTLPFAQRNHRFDGATSYKVFVDPKPSPVGPNEAVVYAALSGTDSNSELTVQGGIWKSVDSGKHWFRLTPVPNQTGFADPTDLIFVPSSADATTGNLRLGYAAYRGQGVYVTGNGGSAWTLLAGGVGNPLIRDPDANSIPVVSPSDNPSGAKGRIVLATPHLSGSRAQDLSYQGWIYAYVSVGDLGVANGFYVSKDFGQNWTKVKLGAAQVGVYESGYLDATPLQTPTNDETAADIEQLGGQGEYDISIAVNPNNPNIVYLGGGAGPEGDVGAYTIIRVDLTGLDDPHNLTAFNNFRNDSGQLWFQTTGSITLTSPEEGKFYAFPQKADVDTAPTRDFPYVNLFRDPNNPFGNASLLNVGNVGTVPFITSFTNTGSRAVYAPWYPMSTAFGPIDADFLGGSVDQHEVISMIDPLTGHARLIFGDDQGLFTVVEREDGSFSSGVGTYGTPFGPRNGNLQINQFYSGATQPSQGAADRGGSMFYGAAQDNGTPSSDKNILKNGNIQWVGPTGDASWVETDQTGSGKVFHYKWPCCGGDTTDFFQVDNVGHTVGLLQQEPLDPQWPDLGGGRFAVNPINPDQVVIASLHGRVFRTGGLPGGYTWFVIGEPDTAGGPFDNTNSFPQALAFGAPDPSDPTLQTDNHIWVGNDAGNIFVTFDGGGHWIKFDESQGLDGSRVRTIVTNPKRGTHEAYAITTTGVFWMRDAATPGATWVNLTGNLFQITHTPFGITDLTETRLKRLQALVADWRVALLDDPNQPNGLTHPVLYVGGVGGVYRSTDKGKTWSSFPNVVNDQAPVKGGYLPNAEITRLELSLGNINPETGFPDANTSEDMLVAHTYGRGSFMIRLKPLNPIEQAFVRGLDQQIYAQKLDANGNPLGGYFLTSGGTFKSFVVGRQGDKLPQVFAVGFDNQVYSQRFDGSGASTGPWSLTAPGQWKSMAVGNLPNGAPELFTVGFDDRLYALKFDRSGNPIGSYFATDSSVQVKQIFVGHDTVNRPQVWAVGFDNQVYSQKFGKQGGSSGPWFLTASGAVKSVTVAHDLSGRPETFVIGTDNNVYYQKFDDNGFPLGGYLALPQKQVSKIVPAHDGANNPEIFVLGFDQTVYGHRFSPDGTPIGGYFLASPGQVKSMDVGFDLLNRPELFVIGLDDQIYYATFFADGLPATGYRLLAPGKVTGLKVTK